MKIVFIVVILIAVGAFFYLKSDKDVVAPTNTDMTSTEGEEVSNDFEGTFVVDADESNAKWTGSKKIIKDYYDSGTIKVKSGTVSFDKGAVTKGEIVFDMKSISGEATSNAKAPVIKLTEHLKSDDFFAVETYPEAKYVVTSSEKTDTGLLLKGDLTLKGKTQPLSVPVVTMMENGNAVLTGTAEVNRATWEIKYGSESFFDDLGDNVINDIFTLQFKVVARP